MMSPNKQTSFPSCVVILCLITIDSLSVNRLSNTFRHSSVGTSVAPDLIVIKVCVTRHFLTAGEEGVRQGAPLPVKRVPVVVKRAGKIHSDVPSGCRPADAALQPAERQGGLGAPGFEGMHQDVVHQIAGHAG